MRLVRGPDRPAVVFGAGIGGGGPGRASGQQIPQDGLAPRQPSSARRRALVGIGGGLAVLAAVIAAVVMTRSSPSVQRSSPGVQRSSSRVQRSSSAVQVYQSLQQETA